MEDESVRCSHTPSGSWLEDRDEIVQGQWRSEEEEYTEKTEGGGQGGANVQTDHPNRRQRVSLSRDGWSTRSDVPEGNP